MNNTRSKDSDFFRRGSHGSASGLTIIELMVSMAIMAISLVAMYMTIIDTQRSIVVEESRESSLHFNTVNLEVVDRAFLRKAQGSHVACTVNLNSGFNVACNANASYCTCNCDADGNCNVLYIRQRDPIDPNGYNNETLVYSTCEAGGNTLKDYTFDSSCGLTCSKGRRPVVYVQTFRDGVRTLNQRYPAAHNIELKRSEMLAGSFCARRYAGVEALEVQSNAYSWNGFDDDKEIQFESASRLLEEVIFTNDNILVKDVVN